MRLLDKILGKNKIQSNERTPLERVEKMERTMDYVEARLRIFDLEKEKRRGTS